METDNDVKNEPGETSKNVSISDGVGQNEGSERLVDTSEVKVSEQSDIDRVSSLSDKFLYLDAKWEDIWARLEIKYWWSADGRTFSCYAINYLVKNIGGDSGNIKLSFNSSSGWGEKELTASAEQDGSWHSINDGGEVFGNVEQAYIKFRYIFDRSGTWDPTAEADTWVYFEPNTPTIDYRIRNVSTRTFAVRGTGGVYGSGTVYLYNTNDNVVGTGVIQSDGSWAANVSLPNGANSMTFYAKQKIGGKYSEKSTDSTVYLAAITAPTPDSVLVSGDVFKGIGLPGTKMRVFRNDTFVNLTEYTTVMGEGIWEASMVTTQPSGVVPVRAEFSRDNHSGLTSTVSYYILGKPIISHPLADSVQDINFQVLGYSGLSGATVHIFKDHSQSEEYGSSIVEHVSGSWSVAVTVPPGPLSLVAEQVLDAVSSGRGPARHFKIRPPVLDAPTVTQASNTVTFSGTTAHTGATVRISKLTGPGDLVLQPAPVSNARWEIIATDWPFGTYRFSAIQDVSDNAQGRIPSVPYEFEVIIGVPVPTDIRFTTTYTPVISGRGINGARVIIEFPDGTAAAPNATVANGQWSSTVLQQWGPVKDRELLITQELNGQASESVSLKVTIPPLAPVITQITDNGLSPDIIGTCWPGADVTLKFSDNNTATHPAIVSGDSWSFRRSSGFAPGTEHTVTVTQTFAQQISEPASRTFAVALPRPTIIEPAANAEVGRDLTVRGDNGMSGAILKIRDAQYDRELDSKPLTADGDWSIDIDGLETRPYFIDARQTLPEPLPECDSEPSEVREFTVVVLPPQVDVPAPGADLPRIGSVSGTGMPGAYVTVWLEGREQPLIENLEVDEHGCWPARVEMEVGDHELWALQRFDGHASRETPRQAFRAVPLAPHIESPADGERVDSDMVVSGFADPGHTVILAAADAPQIPLGQTVVRSDRSWSLPITLERAGGHQTLIAVQWQDSFNSATTERTVLLGAYQPRITAPTEGTWHSHPVELGGIGQSGRGEVVDWFNPESRQAPDFPITGNNWDATSSGALRPGGHWFRFWQSFANAPEGVDVRSRWAETRRIEIEGSDDPLG
jgi:hypothetical protein